MQCKVHSAAESAIKFVNMQVVCHKGAYKKVYFSLIGNSS